MDRESKYIRLFMICVLLSLGRISSTMGRQEGAEPSSNVKLAITNVALEDKSFDPVKEQARIRYRLSEQAIVSVRLYDIDDFLVKTLVTDEPASKGYNVVSWDGRDGAGKYLPPGAYTYVIEAKSLDSKQKAFYDRTDETYGKQLVLRSLSYDDKTGKLEYVLPKAAMLRIRVGIKEGGPLLATLVDWQAQQAGRHQYVWDGKIGPGDVELTQNPMVEFNLAAYSLPDNSVIIRYKKPSLKKTSGSKLPLTERRPERATGRKIYLHAVHLKTQCREPQFRMEFPNATEFTDDGVPIVSGNVPVRITVDERDKKFLQDERFEVVFFIDFVFLYEEEEGLSPSTYILRAAGVNEGKHFLTVNLYSFKDHIGTQTKAIFIKRAAQ